MDYIQKRSVGFLDDASETIQEAKEKHGEVTVGTDTPDNSTEVDAEDDVRGLLELSGVASGAEETEEPTTDESIEYTRRQSFKATEGGLELDTPDEFERAEETKERLGEIQMVNEELERQGNKRRYVATESDAPENAHIHEDAFGKYYYKRLDTEVRPSDVAEYSGFDHHGAMDEAEKAGGTVELMFAMHGNPLLDANTIEAASSWLERHLVLADEDPGSTDTFTHDFKEKIAAAISDVAAETKGEQPSGE